MSNSTTIWDLNHLERQTGEHGVYLLEALDWNVLIDLSYKTNTHSAVILVIKYNGKFYELCKLSSIVQTLVLAY